MVNLFTTMVLLSLICFLLGLINPKLVIRWGSKRNRKSVFLIYGLALFVFFLLVGITAHKKVELPSDMKNIDRMGIQESEKPDRLQPNTEQSLAQEEQSQPLLTGDLSSPANLQEVVSLLKDGKATTLQKKQLFGKWYTGTILIKDVVSEDSEYQPRIKIIAGVKEGSSGSQDNFIEMSFETNDIGKTVKLRKGSHIIVTGKLVDMTIRRTMYMGIGDVEIYHFQDVKID